MRPSIRAERPDRIDPGGAKCRQSPREDGRYQHDAAGQPEGQRITSADPEETGPKEVSNGYSRRYTDCHTGHPNARLFITTPLTTAALDAPSARRTPNSWVRRAAANEVTPYNPTNVSAADTDRPASHRVSNRP